MNPLSRMITRSREVAKSRPHPFVYVRNKSYWSSLKLGLKYGIWDMPSLVLGSLALPLANIFIGFILLFVMPIVAVLVVAIITVSGFAGFLSPQTQKIQQEDSSRQ